MLRQCLLNSSVDLDIVINQQARKLRVLLNFNLIYFRSLLKQMKVNNNEVTTEVIRPVHCGSSAILLSVGEVAVKLLPRS